MNSPPPPPPPPPPRPMRSLGAALGIGNAAKRHGDDSSSVTSWSSSAKSTLCHVATCPMKVESRPMKPLITCARCRHRWHPNCHSPKIEEMYWPDPERSTMPDWRCTRCLKKLSNVAVLDPASLPQAKVTYDLPNNARGRSMCEIIDCKNPPFLQGSSMKKLCKIHAIEERHNLAKAKPATSHVVPVSKKEISKKGLYNFKPDHIISKEELKGLQRKRKRHSSSHKSASNDESKNDSVMGNVYVSSSRLPNSDQAGDRMSITPHSTLTRESGARLNKPEAKVQEKRDAGYWFSGRQILPSSRKEPLLESPERILSPRENPVVASPEYVPPETAAVVALPVHAHQEEHRATASPDYEPPPTISNPSPRPTPVSPITPKMDMSSCKPTHSPLTTSTQQPIHPNSPKCPICKNGNQVCRGGYPCWRCIQFGRDTAEKCLNPNYRGRRTIKGQHRNHSRSLNIETDTEMPDASHSPEPAPHSPKVDGTFELPVKINGNSDTNGTLSLDRHASQSAQRRSSRILAERTALGDASDNDEEVPVIGQHSGLTSVSSSTMSKDNIVPKDPVPFISLRKPSGPQPVKSTVPPTMEAKQRQSAFDSAILDSFLTKQCLSGQHDGSISEDVFKGQIWGHIDPRVTWPKEHSEEWLTEKRVEIEERGGRKARMGKLLTMQVRKERMEKGWSVHQTKEIVDDTEGARALEELFGIKGIDNFEPGVKDGAFVMTERPNPNEENDDGRRKRRLKTYPLR